VEQIGQTKQIEPVLTEKQLTQIEQLRIQVVDDKGFEEMVYEKLDRCPKSDVLKNLNVYIRKDEVELLAYFYADELSTFEKLMDDMTLRVPMHVDIDARQLRVGVFVLKTISYTNTVWKPYDIIIDDDNLQYARRIEEAVERRMRSI